VPEGGLRAALRPPAFFGLRVAISNFDRDGDIAAPGVFITSTYLDDWYATFDGTSMSSPHVAGAAALYVHNHRHASPQAVKQAARLGGAGPIPQGPRPDRERQLALDPHAELC
jgi:subtilisin family serine protease